MVDREVTWGFAGCGDIAEKRVVKAIQSAAGGRLAGCTRRDPRRLSEFQSRHSIPRGYADYRSARSGRVVRLDRSTVVGAD